jgi:hypothetical protein
MTQLRTLTTATVSVLGGVLLSGAIASTASALSFVPQQEGEINAGVGPSLDANGYIAGDLGFTVESLEFTATKGGEAIATRSRLFVDQAGTSNSYLGGISFRSRDIGTSDTNQSFWFRPVAMITGRGGTVLERGELEVGRFAFNFNSTLESLTLDFFDVEKRGTSVLKVNGEAVDIAIAPGRNNSLQNLVLNNVNTIELMLGNADTGGRYAAGDGVLLQASGQPTEEVPEPTTMAGIALAGAGLAYARRRKQATA